jgi:hypothetical protein
LPTKMCFVAQYYVVIGIVWPRTHHPTKYLPKTESFGRSCANASCRKEVIFDFH